MTRRELILRYSGEYSNEELLDLIIAYIDQSELNNVINLIDREYEEPTTPRPH